MKRGREHGNWKGGSIHSHGYIVIYEHGHPFADKFGRIYEHRLVMEKHIGRHLLPGESVHHINGIKSDNRIENLKLFNSYSEHIKHEWKQNPNYSSTTFKRGQPPKPHSSGCPCPRCSVEKLKAMSFKKGSPPPLHKSGCKCFRCTKIPINRKSLKTKDF